MITDSERVSILQKRLAALRRQWIFTEDGRALGNLTNAIIATKETLQCAQTGEWDHERK